MNVVRAFNYILMKILSGYILLIRFCSRDKLVILCFQLASLVKNMIQMEING